MTLEGESLSRAIRMFAGSELRDTLEVILWSERIDLTDFEVITGILRDYNEKFKALLPDLNTALLKMEQYIERQRLNR